MDKNINTFGEKEESRRKTGEIEYIKNNLKV